MIASRSWAPGRLVHLETTADQHASSSGIADADRPVDPQTAGGADALAGSTGPSRGARHVSRPRAANDARDSALAISPHPDVDKVRHVGCPSGASLRSFRQRDRADSRQSLTLLRPLAAVVPSAGIADKGKAPRGNMALSGSSLCESSVVGGPHSAGRVLHPAMQTSDALQSSPRQRRRLLHVIIGCVA